MRFAFLLSGATCLLHQLVWIRWLGFGYGNTPRSAAVALSLFFAGQAAGALAVPASGTGIRSPLLWLAVAEAGSVLSGLLAVFGGHSPALFLVLSTLKGVTLPLGARLGPPGADRTRETAWLYAFNTLGAAAGALLAGLYLMGALGYRKTVLVACLAGAATAGLFAALHRGTGRACHPEERPAVVQGIPPPDPPGRDWDWRGIVFLFGWCGTALEIYWLRAFSLVSGSSVYTLALVTASVIVAVSAGASAGSRSAPAAGRDTPGRFIPLYCCGALFLSIALFPEAIPMFWRVYLFSGGRFPLFLGGLFLLVALFSFLPSFASGYVVARAIRSAGGGGGGNRAVPLLLAFSAAGCALAPIPAAFGRFPSLGIRYGLIGIAALLWAGGVWFASIRSGTGERRPWKPRLAAILTILPLVPALAIPWDVRILHAGLFAVAPWMRARAGGPKEVYEEAKRKVPLFATDGPEGSVAVFVEGGNRFLSVNGKPESSAVRDMRTQVALGILPSILLPRVRDGLVIGFGSGATMAALLASADGTVSCSETSEGVVAAAPLFESVNRGAHRDPRGRILREDGRNTVRRKGPAWDAIVSQPSNPWVLGSSGLFSREFYLLCSERLSPGGVMVQWLQAYGISRESLESQLSTFRSVFPRVLVFSFRPGDLILAGSSRPLVADLDAYRAAFARLPLQPLLRQAGFRSPERFAGGFFGAWDREGDPSIWAVDDLPGLEYDLPRMISADTIRGNMEWLRGATTGGVEEGMRGAVAGVDHSTWNEVGKGRSEFGFPEHAFDLFREAVRRKPDFAEGWNNLGVSAFARADRQSAEYFRKAVALDPRNAGYRENLQRAGDRGP